MLGDYKTERGHLLLWSSPRHALAYRTCGPRPWELMTLKYRNETCSYIYPKYAGVRRIKTVKDYLNGMQSAQDSRYLLLDRFGHVDALNRVPPHPVGR